MQLVKLLSYEIYIIIYWVFLANYAAGEIINFMNLRFFNVIVKSYFRIRPQNDLMHSTPYKNLNDIHFDTVLCKSNSITGLDRP